MWSCGLSSRRRFESVLKRITRVEHRRSLRWTIGGSRTGPSWLVVLRPGGTSPNASDGGFASTEARPLRDRRRRRGVSAHRHGVAHGRIRPANILFDDEVMLTCLGLRRRRDLARRGYVRGDGVRRPERRGARPRWSPTWTRRRPAATAERRATAELLGCLPLARLLAEVIVVPCRPTSVPPETVDELVSVRARPLPSPPIRPTFTPAWTDRGLVGLRAGRCRRSRRVSPPRTWSACWPRRTCSSWWDCWGSDRWSRPDSSAPRREWSSESERWPS